MNNQLLLNYKILYKKHQNLESIYNKCKNQNKIIDEEELFESLNDVLAWFEPTILNLQFNISDSKYISALKFVNNKRKHCEKFYKITLSTLSLYPSDNLYPNDNLYPLSFGIYWENLKLDKECFKNQYNNYNKVLLNKNVIETLSEIMKIINKNITKINNKVT